jgi:diadenosine tetraphosphate (Ap4A) HIT family hydrolase
MSTCVLCNQDGGEIICHNDLFRIIWVEDKNYPGFVRLILNKHSKEMSELDENIATTIFKALLKIEKIIIELYHPDKINLASLGNVVPHLHWHIIPRYKNDRHFPNPIWGEISNPSYIVPVEIISLKDKLFKLLQKSTI